MRLLKEREVRIIFILGVFQLLHLLDFVLLMPLGPSLMRLFEMSPAAFGLLVSSYTWSSTLFLILGIFFLDRFDRKRALMLSYAGFLMGTLWFSQADSYYELLFSRSLAGAFAGWISASIMSIIADEIPNAKRGRAYGVIAAAFPVAASLGVPLGLVLADWQDWRFPFLVLVVLGISSGLVASFLLPSMTSHLSSQRNSWKEGLSFATDFKLFPSYLCVSFLRVSGFMVIPYIAAYFVQNLSVQESELFMIYLFGGGLTFFTSLFVGRLSDKYNRFRVFWIASLCSILPIFLLTHLTTSSLILILISSSLFMASLSARFIPTLAMMSEMVAKERRGGFMSVLTCFQHLAVGFGSFLSGWILSNGDKGELVGFGHVGTISVAFTLLAILSLALFRPKKARV
jgi:predicted MFS family arabinose efflux permease